MTAFEIHGDSLSVLVIFTFSFGNELFGELREEELSGNEKCVVR